MKRAFADIVRNRTWNPPHLAGPKAQHRALVPSSGSVPVLNLVDVSSESLWNRQSLPRQSSSAPLEIFSIDTCYSYRDGDCVKSVGCRRKSWLGLMLT
jgi:hypothetical protein